MLFLTLTIEPANEFRLFLFFQFRGCYFFLAFLFSFLHVCNPWDWDRCQLATVISLSWRNTIQTPILTTETGAATVAGMPWYRTPPLWCSKFQMFPLIYCCKYSSVVCSYTNVSNAHRSVICMLAKLNEVFGAKLCYLGMSAAALCFYDSHAWLETERYLVHVFISEIPSLPCELSCRPYTGATDNLA